ncbi:MAG TPA: DUF2007 domain-containing protein [Thermoanaerobaculia bacterium]|jgi:predicted RNA-binding Zn-ribbon protein involved in translation (DUF1610 family)|nr:DUF2007 domain-containing protein [Thermoanaerobaculia bacterium]
MPLVTLTTFRTAHDAHLAKAVLEDEGVPAFLGDENVTSIAPYVVANGVRLQVAADDFDRAEGILNRIAGMDVAEKSTASAERAIRHPEQCPRCGSPDVRRTRRLLGFSIAAALLFAVGVAVDQLVMTFYLAMAICIFFLVASPFRCANCGHRW